MGQTDVLNILEREKDKWFTAKELSKELEVSHSTAALLAKKLWKQKDIDRKSLNHKTYIYKIIGEKLNKKRIPRLLIYTRCCRKCGEYFKTKKKFAKLCKNCNPQKENKMWAEFRSYEKLKGGKNV